MNNGHKIHLFVSKVLGSDICLQSADVKMLCLKIFLWAVEKRFVLELSFFECSHLIAWWNVVSQNSMRMDQAVTVLMYIGRF